MLLVVVLEHADREGVIFEAIKVLEVNEDPEVNVDFVLKLRFDTVLKLGRYLKPKPSRRRER